MRVAIVTESFLPTVNGVTNSVARVTEELTDMGHEVLIVAPGKGLDRFGGTPVVRTPAVPLPGYAAIPVGMPTPATFTALECFRPDVVHVGGPVALGAWGLSAARRLAVPAVAVYQTDFPRFARHYRVAGAERMAWSWLRRIHSSAALTLAPSSAAVWDLRRNGVPNVRLWGRGVDLQRFHPARRCGDLRAQLAPDGQVLVGYVGRLAPEKQVQLLRSIRGVKGTRLVIVGDGPDRGRLERTLPGAAFTGYKGGTELARLFASLDVFVHTGPHETFCQAVQEALASGVPVVGPAIGGPLDLIRHQVNGLLFRPGDGRGLRRYVAGLVADERTRAAMGRAARQGVEGRSWAVLTDALVGHYVDAIRGTTPQGRPTAALTARRGAS